MNKQLKALRVIECLTEITAIEKEYDISVMKKMIDKIYRLSHIATEPSCIDSHKDWIEELEGTYKDLVNGGWI